MRTPLLRKQTTSSLTPGGMAASFLVLFGAIGTFVAVLVTTNSGSIVPPFAFPVYRDAISQAHACACKTDWNLATNERLISNDVFAQSMSIPDARGLSSMVAFWGQFVDHDIVASLSDPSQGYFEITLVPGSALLNLTRSEYELVAGCRAAVSNSTPWIDASTIYGDSLKPNRINDLRVPGQCEMQNSTGDLLPLAPGGMEYFSGDDRVTETAVLTSLHTLWMREHNRLCGILRTNHPDWSADARFWKARQLVAAKIQYITYNEWLPQLLGNATGWTGPLKRTDAQMVAEFSVAAYRIGHSMIPASIGMFALENLFFNVTLLQTYGPGTFLEAAYQTAMETADDKVVDALRNMLFGPEVREDLVSRNLFRARDLQLGAYQTIATCYGNTSPDSPAYPDPAVGLFGEAIPAGSSLPYTVGLIISEQFQRIRQYDPNFYTKINLGPYAVNVTLAQVIRDNTDLTAVPDNVFSL